MIEKFNNIAQSIFCEDFVCFSEMWLKSVECTEYYVEHYHCINKPRSFHHKRAKRGAGGILLYINNRIWSNVAVLSNMTADNRVWIKLYDTSTEDNDVYISFCYLPPRDSSVTCNNQSEWSHFESEVINMSTRGNILLCGDFDARTGTKCDYDAEPPLPYIINNGTPRQSSDVTVNAQGKYLLDLCISMRLRILNGRFRGDCPGKYTCFTAGGCSIVDYAIISAVTQQSG